MWQRCGRQAKYSGKYVTESGKYHNPITTVQNKGYSVFASFSLNADIPFDETHTFAYRVRSFCVYAQCI